MRLFAGLVFFGASPLARGASQGPSQSAPAQPPSHDEPSVTPDFLEVSAEPAALTPETPIVVGQPFRLTITARHSPGRIAEIPRTLDLGTAFVELGERRTHDRRRERDREIDVYLLEVIALEVGEQTLPSIPVALGPRIEKTAGVRVRVLSNLDPSERDVATATNPQALAALESMAAPNPQAAAVMITSFRLLLVVAGLLAVVAAVAIARRARGRLPAVQNTMPPAAHEIALDRLRALAARARAVPVKPVYVELSAVLRRYIGERYGFEALERTIDELMDKVGEVERPGLDPERLRHILEEADLVKFAKFEPPEEACRSAIGAAISLIEATRPHAELPTQDQEAATGPI